jgi:sugar phosphate isomerase/epimerase
MRRRIDRRAFLERAVQIAACAALARSASRDAHAAGRMFISLNSSLTNQKAPWPEFARVAARVGYGGTDVMLDAAMKEGADATNALLKELKIKPGVLNLPVRFGGEASEFDQGMARLDEAATFAAAIGCPRMMAVLPPASATPKAEYRVIIKDRVTRIGETLRRSNVRLGLEFLGPLHFRTRQPHEFIWRMDETLAFAKECGPNVGLTLDAWHWHHAGATAADILAAGASRIVHIHVSDAKAQPPEEVRDNQRLLPGEGIIDLTTFFSSLKKIGYQDAVSPEPIGRVPPDTSPEEGARLGLQSTEAVMKKAGVL